MANLLCALLEEVFNQPFTSSPGIFTKSREDMFLTYIPVLRTMRRLREEG